MIQLEVVQLPQSQVLYVHLVELSRHKSSLQGDSEAGLLGDVQENHTHPGQCGADSEVVVDYWHQVPGQLHVKLHIVSSLEGRGGRASS